MSRVSDACVGGTGTRLPGVAVYGCTCFQCWFLGQGKSLPPGQFSSSVSFYWSSVYHYGLDQAKRTCMASFVFGSLESHPRRKFCGVAAWFTFGMNIPWKERKILVAGGPIHQDSWTFGFGMPVVGTDRTQDPVDVEQTSLIWTLGQLLQGVAGAAAGFRWVSTKSRESLFLRL